MRNALTGIQQPDMIQKIDAVLPKVKASVPDASDDAIVNAMIEAYCPIAGGASPAEHVQLLGSFGGLVYGQIKKVDMGGPIKN